MKRNILKITHFISFSGAILSATPGNYADDSARYIGAILQNIDKAINSRDDHDARAYALTAGLYARHAASMARTALMLGYVC